jgi:8-amino-7-oxononanoate synthase
MARVLDDLLAQELAAIDEQGLRRRLRAVDTRQGPRVRVDGIEATNFSSNNYLGLASHLDLAAAAHAALDAEGVGAGAARLIVGNLPSHRRLEQLLAEVFRSPAALLFNSGYQANVGVLAALAGPDDAIFSDALNHASLIDGCRLSRARTHVYRHVELEHLDALLRANPARRRFIVSDTIFSMDGDRAPLAALRALADQHGAALVVDEAHATGVVGPRGRGVAAAEKVRIDVHLATLSKAVGTFGAFVSGSRILVDYLLHRARSFVFTTALPPAIAAAAAAALQIVASAEGDRLRAKLQANVTRFAAALASRGLLAAGAGQTPIFPILIGDERRALDVSRRLLERGVFAQAIRAPTVAPGAARLRFALMASHTGDMIDHALDALDATLP